LAASGMALFFNAGSGLAANTDNWIVGNGDWNTGGHWNRGVVPGSGDIVNIGISNSASFTVTYDYAGPNITLGTMYVSIAGAGGTATPTLSLSSGNLASSFEEIGASGVGAINQTAGVNSPAQLSLGNGSGDVGTYLLSGSGDLAANVEYVGNQGTGTFNQTGGTVSDYSIGVGNGLTSSGTYNFSDGAINTTTQETIGDVGTGVFNQSGGTNTFSTANNYYLEIAEQTQSTSTYVMSGGALNAGIGEVVGYHGTGLFNQTGGTNTVVGTSAGGYLYLGVYAGSTGTYTLSGGSLTVPTYELIGEQGDGIFNQTGGTNTVNGTGMLIAATTGSTGSYVLIGGTLDVTGGVYVGGSPSGAGGQGTLDINVSTSTNASISGILQVWADGFVRIRETVLTVGALSIASGGTVDVDDGLVISSDGGKPSAAETTIQQYIENGAIISSTANGNSSDYGIAYADGSDTGLLDPYITPGEIVVEPDLFGDADMNGVVNFHDLQILLGNFGDPGFWDQGNFNNHATIDFNDLQLLLGEFGGRQGLSASELEGIERLVGEFGYAADPNASGTGFTLVAVPEPRSVGLMVAGIGLMMRRRRRQGFCAGGVRYKLI